jgi:hypothetical protein
MSGSTLIRLSNLNEKNSLNVEKVYCVMIGNSGNLSSTSVESVMILHLLSRPIKVVFNCPRLTINHFYIL